MSQKTCYLHPDRPAVRTCDNCSRPICSSDVVPTIEGEIYQSIKKWKNFPLYVCPQCIDSVKAQLNIQQKDQVRGYMAKKGVSSPLPVVTGKKGLIFYGGIIVLSVLFLLVLMFLRP